MKEEDIEVQQRRHIMSLNEEDFPLVCTFEDFLTLVERTIQ